MKKVIKRVSLALLVGAFVSVPLLAKAVALPATGGNPVKVSACTNISGGVSITHTSGSTYNLMNGKKDAGHGYKEYTYTCTTNTQYYVSWKPAVQPAPVQPELASLEVLHKMPNTGVPRAFQSYKNGLSFGTPLTYQLVKNNLTSVLVKATKESANTTNLSYAFAWTSSEHNTQMYTEAKVAALAKTANFQSSDEYLFTITDYYRGKYSLLLAFVRNNDGISAVPNMPAGVEVDDVIPVFLRFETKANPPVPEPVCENTTGNGPLITLCQNSLFTHQHSGIIIQPTAATNASVTLKFYNATRTEWTLKKNQSVHLVSTINQREIELTYTGKTPSGMLRFTVKDVPSTPAACQNMSGTGGTFAICQGNTLTLEHGVKALVIYANQDILLLKLSNTNDDIVYMFKGNGATVYATNTTNRYYSMSYRGLDASGKALLYTELATIQ